MADKTGYIGRNPGDSSVVIARQTFSPTGVQTDFTFTSGYTVGYLDLFVNGAKLVEGSDYTATDGVTVSVVGGGATTGDILEAVAYKAFNLSVPSNTPGNFIVGGYVSATNGFVSDSGSPVEITVVGSDLTFTVQGVGTTTLTLS